MMIVLILALPASLIPCIGLYLWLRNGLPGDPRYQSICSKALTKGMLSVFPVLLTSAVFAIVLGLTGIRESRPLVYQFFYKFFVLAFAEEFVKLLTLRGLLRKNDYPYSWLNIIALATIIGLGFDIMESIVYAVGESVPVVLVRGICVPHAGYGFIVGYFYGRAQKTGRRSDIYLGFLLSWLIHGMYDFSLSEELLAVNDNFAIVAVLLALLDILLWIWLIVFSRKARNNPKYTEPMRVTAAEEIL